MHALLISEELLSRIFFHIQPLIEMKIPGEE